MRWIINIMISSMIFFPDKVFYETPAQYDLTSEDVVITTEDGVKIHGWFLDADQPKGALLFLHGNAGNISGRVYKAQGWVERGFSVFLLDYRGYGKSEGEIKHEDDIYRDAKAGFNWLRESKKFPLSKIILYGESLGSNPAIRLGAENRVNSVVLEAPYTSFVDLAPIHYPVMPKPLSRMLLKDFELSNTRHIESLKSPLFILHGTRDETCPYAMGEELFDKAPEPKGFFSVTNGAHNDLPMTAGRDYWDKPAEFVSNRL
ncbi:MAG: alpha/beta fold hydrolase [Candidatus Omnitrophota bacterium]|nr:alpha/beta fold hydrolase [Candidatus Omnitrophota bacterium]